MHSVLPIDFADLIEGELVAGDRAPDGLLHPSTHLAAPLRHAQLDLAGAPKKPRPLIDRIVLHTGTLWHQQVAQWFVKNGIPAMVEVNLSPWMPKGWGGTADLVIWSPEYKAFALADLKTTKGESLQYRVKSGASEDHVLQTSVYWHALRKMGLPLVKAINVIYLPKNDTRSKDQVIRPLMIEFEPLPLRALNARMAERKKNVDQYVSALPKPNPRPLFAEEFLTDDLAPEQDMEQRVYFDRASGDQVLKLVPHWSTAYCPFEDDVCSCSTQRSTTIGRWRNETAESYEPRKGYEDIQPVVFPG